MRQSLERVTNAHSKDSVASQSRALAREEPATLPPVVSYSRGRLEHRLSLLSRDRPPYARVGVLLRETIAAPLGTRELVRHLRLAKLPDQIDAVRALLTSLDGRLSKTLTPRIRSFFMTQGSEFAPHVAFISRDLATQLYLEELDPSALKEVRRYLRSVGLKPHQFVGSAFDSRRYEIPKTPLFASNIEDETLGLIPSVAWSVRAIRTLEEVAPGASAELAKRFGMRVFARYPLSYLLDLYEKSGSRHHEPTVFWCFPVTDHNGGCCVPELVEAVHARAARLGIGLVCLEAGNERTLTSLLGILLEQWSNPVGLIFSGHSCGKVIDLSSGGAGLSASCLERVLSQSGAGSVLGRLPIVLDGCRTARRGAMAEQLSTLREGVVGGMVGCAEFCSATLRRKAGEGEPIFRVRFSLGGKTFQQGKVISAGRSIQVRLSA